MTSRMNQGAMFEIIIPFARKKLKKRSKSAKKKIKNAQILIVQDGDFIRELMAQFFNKKGCRVDTAINGLEGLGKMKKRKCDLVIADTELDDVDRDSFCISPEDIRNKITERTKAIIAVHLFGNSADMDAIMKIAEEYNLYVIEDCAQAHGTEFRGRKVGSIGQLGAFSFFK